MTLKALAVYPDSCFVRMQVIKALRTHPGLRRLVYISCNPESLVANAIELCTPSVDKTEIGNTNNRGWRNMSSSGLARHRAKSMPNSEPFQPIKAMAVDLFPHTPHCELVMLLERIEMEEDYRNLVEYGICEFSEIIVFLKTMSCVVADPPSRRLSLVVQTSSSLLNAASIPVEMKDSNTVNELRQLLLTRKILPMDDYMFIHKQRIMRENCSLRWHGVENGDCLYVFKGTVSRSGY
ncbi:hypothetical protein F0562_017998 [Nyssa sinensis]|uniref:Ubiquitin-like domain-containing protein n=1 Tax=Nyssa sinensis TaxID=561372 RepID=A0A5J4ZA55_9ASTE|nr:hypothetical protein F0562_017998 [Nyssa sinensis]